MVKKLDKDAVRQKRHLRIRKNISGTPERPRFNVYRSDKNMYVQIIDDTVGNTLVACSTIDKEVVAQIAEMTKSEAAKVVGTVAAKRALEKGISEVVFDRGGYLYTGRVASVAEGARAAGLKIGRDKNASAE